MRRIKAHIVRVLGYAACILTPAAAMYDQFGYLITQQQKSWTDILPCSLVVIFMTLLCFKPIFNLAKRHLRSDAAWKMWLVVALLGGIGVLAGKSMFVIGCFGFGGNVIGHFMIRRAERILSKAQED